MYSLDQNLVLGNGGGQAMIWMLAFDVQMFIETR